MATVIMFAVLLLKNDQKLSAAYFRQEKAIAILMLLLDQQVNELSIHLLAQLMCVSNISCNTSWCHLRGTGVHVGTEALC